MSLEFTVKKFFQKYQEDPPFLLGLSGGEDSSCLFHILCKLKIPFGAVYVDHRWRPESQDEAKGLKIQCESAEIPFHKEEIFYEEKIENLESYCRGERLKIFRSLKMKHGYSGVILAHHAKDLAETVLKRIFEGASLLKFKGMEQISINDGLKIVRPLLTVPKEEIKKYILEKQIHYFPDSSNDNTRFLRARMRKELFPLIQKSFGKNIEKPLIRLSHESALMHDFLEKRTDSLISRGIWSHFGYCLDLSNEKMHEVEARHIIMRVAKMLNIRLSSREFQDASVHLLTLSQKKIFQQLQIDRGRILWQRNEKAFT